MSFLRYDKKRRRDVAQLVERVVRDHEAGGSSPLVPTIFIHHMLLQ